MHNEKLQGFEVYIGGGQGEKNGKPTLSAFSKPFAAVSEEDLLPVLDGIVQVHQDWGDRQNRHWARLKYVVKANGISWFREQVEARTGITLGEPDPSHDLGDRFLHHGWLDHPDPELLNFGAFIENGRIADTESNGRLKTMVREIMNRYPIQVRFTAEPGSDLQRYSGPMRRRNLRSNCEASASLPETAAPTPAFALSRAHVWDSIPAGWLTPIPRR